jgi:adenylate cyclase
MTLEIERKFLVDTSRLPGCLKQTPIAQGYLSIDKDRTVRIRVANNKGYMTVKGPSSENGLTRFEWEHKIPAADAAAMMFLCEDAIVKTRSHMIVNGHLWEIDTFDGLNKGLVVAEIELTHEDEIFTIPDWVTKEVTGDVRYYNSSLLNNPYTRWK